jgi:hypothetical protein
MGITGDFSPQGWRFGLSRKVACNADFVEGVISVFFMPELEKLT